MSFNSSDDDSQQRFALGFLIALIALLISVVVGTVVVKQLGGSAQSQPAATAVQAPRQQRRPQTLMQWQPTAPACAWKTAW
jgi:hypothetical protein